jgi:cysteine synthase
MRDGIRRGIISQHTTVIESSSGNLAVSLAWICARTKLSFLAVVDPTITTTNLARLALLGAQIDRVVTPDPDTGAFLPARITRAKQICEQRGNHVWLDQYSNPANPLAHHQTASEIFDRFPDFHIVIVALSTCGTARGIFDYIKRRSLTVDLVVVDAAGSLITGLRNIPRNIPGMGAAIKPPHFGRMTPARTHQITDVECVAGCREFLRREGFLAGGSSGAAYMVALREARRHHGHNIVFVAPDRGENYLDTIYSDNWLTQRLMCTPEDLDHLIKSVLSRPI